MSSAPRAPAPFSSAPHSVVRRTPNESVPFKPSRASAVPSTAGQGLARSPSLRQSRATRKVPSRSNTSSAAEDDDKEEDEPVSGAQLVADLKEQLRRAEDASEQYRKQLDVLQLRLNEVSQEQTDAEVRELKERTELDTLRMELKDHARQRRELEQSHKAEKDLLLRERDSHATREGELQSVIQRLNETLRSKDMRRSSMLRTQSDLEQFSQQETTRRSSIDHNSAIVQRDNIIDGLRTELADAQLRTAEVSLGATRMQEMEKALLDLTMTNARLQEESESFQYLLGEKTLKGDFVQDSRIPECAAGLSSLAEELDSAGDDADGQSDAYKRLDAEVKTLRDGNKALTLYIDKIIGRLLQHEGFEHIILERDEPPELPIKMATLEKPLPTAPVPQAMATLQQSAPSLLQRAKSVVVRPGVSTARPLSFMQPLAPTPNANPVTAPRIPINKGHRRARSDQTQKDMGGAAVVQQMTRGSPLRTVSGGAISPVISPMSPQLNPSRTSYFQSSSTPSAGATSLSAATSRDRDRGSSANSLASELSGEKESTDASSMQTSNHGSSNIPGAVMKQNQLRPLRLVREQANSEEELRKANRGSWMGWLKGSTLEAHNG